MMLHKIKLPDIDKTIEFSAEAPITPPEKGIFTPIKDWTYPYKGYPVEMTVEILAAIKGFMPVGLRFAEQSIKHFDLLALWSLKNTWREVLMYSGKILHRRMPKNPQRFGRAVREVYRVLTIQMERIGKKRDSPLFWLYCVYSDLRSVVCVICEFDNAYRYRVQDFLIEMNVINLIRSPIRELRRLLDLMIERENREHLKNKWRRIKLILTLVLILKPKLKNKIVEILSEIKKEEIQFEDDDWYLIAMRNDYNFWGLTQEEVIKTRGFEKVGVNGV